MILLAPFKPGQVTFHLCAAGLLDRSRARSQVSCSHLPAAIACCLAASTAVDDSMPSKLQPAPPFGPETEMQPPCTALTLQMLVRQPHAKHLQLSATDGKAGYDASFWLQRLQGIGSAPVALPTTLHAALTASDVAQPSPTTAHTARAGLQAASGREVPGMGASESHLPCGQVSGLGWVRGLVACANLLTLQPVG